VQHRGMRRIAWGALLVLTACGDDDRTVGEGDAGTMPEDAGVDAAARDVGMPDAGPRDCASILVEDRPFALAPGFRETQIHPAAVHDGEHAWVALTVDEEDSSVFDVFLVRAACDGSVDPPIPVNTTTEPNDLDAAIALGDDGVLVAWISDTGGGLPGAITTYTRAFDLEGAPRAASDRQIELTRGGEPYAGTAWMAALASTDEGFVLAGSRGVEELAGFAVYTLALDAEGAPAGEATEPSPTMDAGQSDPEVAVDGSGVHAIWTEQLEETHGMYAPPGGEARRVVEGVVSSSATDIEVDGERVLVATSAGGSSAAEIRIVDVSNPEADVLSFGRTGRLDAGADMALGEDGALGVVWLRNEAGFRNELFVRGARWDEGTWTVGEERQVPMLDPVPPYAPAIVHVEGDLYFVTWAEGNSPRFEVYGMYTRL